MSQTTKINTFITVQEKDFSLAAEYQKIRTCTESDGAIVTFVGLVREFSEHGTLEFMTLEHYPGMTERSLENICDKARQKWPLGVINIIHRTGVLTPSEQIVFVGVSSKHRKSAFAASEFIIDFLKVNAPFWKKEITHSGEYWVNAKNSDKDKALQWQA